MLEQPKLLHIPILYDASNLAAERHTVYLSQMCRESMIRVPGKSERRQITFKSETDVLFNGSPSDISSKLKQRHLLV